MLIAVRACAVCRTDLHVVDGELPDPKLPLIPGHEIVGTVVERGEGADRFAIGDRVGVPWLGWTCGICAYCRSGQENLCDHARFTGYQIDGGYAELTVADQRYCFAIDPSFGDVEAAPLLCAGLIGYRTLAPGRRCASGSGFTGSGRRRISWRRSRAIRAARSSRSRARATRAAQDFARGLGAVWAGGSDETPPEKLDAALIFAPVGALVPAALAATPQGRHGRLRRHPYERHPGLSVSAPVGGAGRPLGRQPDPPRRRGISRPRSGRR